MSAGNTFTTVYPNVPNNGDPIKGQTVTQEGFMSKAISDHITYVTYNYTDSTGSWYNLIRTDKPAIKGDSGGPVYSTQYYGSSLINLVYGIAHTSDLSTYTTFVKVKNIKLSYSNLI